MSGETGMQMLGASQGGGPTTDNALLSAAQAVAALSNPCDLSVASAPVTFFQQAWNADVAGGVDPNMASATDGSGNVIGQLTVDGKYGPETAAAVAAAFGGNVIAACTAYTNGSQPAPQPPQPSPAPPPAPLVPVDAIGMPGWAKVLLAAVIVGAVGVIGYVIWKRKGGRRKAGAHEAKAPKRRRRRRSKR